MNHPYRVILFWGSDNASASPGRLLKCVGNGEPWVGQSMAEWWRMRPAMTETTVDGAPINTTKRFLLVLHTLSILIQTPEGVFRVWYLNIFKWPSTFLASNYKDPWRSLNDRIHLFCRQLWGRHFGLVASGLPWRSWVIVRCKSCRKWPKSTAHCRTCPWVQGIVDMSYVLNCLDVFIFAANMGWVSISSAPSQEVLRDGGERVTQAETESGTDMGVSWNGGTPKWIVYKGKSL